MYQQCVYVCACVSPPALSQWWTDDTPHTEPQNGSGSPSRSRGRHPWKDIDKLIEQYKNTWVGIFDFQLTIAAAMNDLLADVLASQHFAAGFTLEAAQVPLSIKCQKSLAILNISTTSCTICKKKKSSNLCPAEVKKNRKRKKNECNVSNTNRVERNYWVIRAFWALKASYVPVSCTKKKPKSPSTVVVYNFMECRRISIKLVSKDHIS